MRLGWGKVVEFWILDAKQVIFTHLDALVLLTILGNVSLPRSSTVEVAGCDLTLCLRFATVFQLSPSAQVCRFFKSGTWCWPCC